MTKLNPLTDVSEVPLALLKPNQVLTIGDADLLHLSARNQTVRLCLAGLEGHRSLTISLAPGQGRLLAIDDTALRVIDGEVDVRRLGVVDFAKLLAFVDGADAPGAPPPSSADAPFVTLDLAPEHSADARALEYWFIRRLLDGDESFAALKAFLRRLETYWLVKYLVSESAQQKKVSDLGDEYGLSYSHFRRVCKAALGNSVKSELKVWRAARSLLDVVEGQESMTEVAIRNGYASSSHFSTEIKKLFGLSPRAILDLPL